MHQLALSLLASALSMCGGDDAPIQKGTDWWSLQPIQRVSVPKSGSPWSRTPIDSFIIDTLQKKGLAPSREADARTLIRRLTYDLHGLPPTPHEVDQFVNDVRPDAYERLVDRLLDSPRYGERWARRWLDIVHYGESHGYDKDKPRPNAWPYRDYVIQSLNSDKPFDRFVKEQIAGDVLYSGDPDATIATGFIAAGPWDFVGHVELPETKTDGLIARYNDRDDMVSTTMSTFVSLTVHCARCHDHKFDPITQQDYYRLQAVFAGVDRADRPFDRDRVIHEKRRQLSATRVRLEQELRSLEEPVSKITSPEIQSMDRRLAEVKAELARLPAPSLVYAAAAEFSRQGNFAPALQPRPVHLLLRGDVKQPGPLMTAGSVASVHGLNSDFGLLDSNDEGARRAALACWIADPRNPLTWRSIVNRVWQYHFGRGIVDTPNDFGHMGDAPSHPEMLDWLATWFLENGQSLKALHRLIVTSSAYRQSSQISDLKSQISNLKSASIDGDNRYLWRMNRMRLDAESIRDAALYAAGQLDSTMGGPSVQQFLFKDDHSPVYDYTRFEWDSPGARRRSIYRFVVRSVPDPFMDSFDCPDSCQLTPKRNTTVTALQALSMLNNPFVVSQAEHLAERVRAEANDLGEQIALAFQLTLSRLPTPEESNDLLNYATMFGLANVCRLLLNSNEFMFVD